MPSVNSVSLLEEFNAYKADITSPRKEGKITTEFDVVLTGLCFLVAILIAVFLDKRAKKTSRNSNIPPSPTGKDKTRKSPRKNRDMRAARNSMTGENFETVTVCRENLYCRSL